MPGDNPNVPSSKPSRTREEIQKELDEAEATQVEIDKQLIETEGWDAPPDEETVKKFVDSLEDA